MKRRALFIGVNQYTNGLPELACAVNDAGALQEFFEQCGYQTAIVRNADTNDILTAIEEQTKDLKRDDVFLFFFAGHGYTVENKDSTLDRRLAGQKDRRHRILSGQDGVRLEEIRRSVSDAHCSCVIIMDACQTTIKTERGTGSCREACTARDLQAITSMLSHEDSRNSDNGFVVINSCQEGDVAYELESEQHGLFTLALLDVVHGMKRIGANACFDDNFAKMVADRMHEHSHGRFRQRPLCLFSKRLSKGISIFPTVEELQNNAYVDADRVATEQKRVAEIRAREEMLATEEERLRVERVRQEAQFAEERKRIQEERKRQDNTNQSSRQRQSRLDTSVPDTINLPRRYGQGSAETRRLRQERLMREAHEKQVKLDALHNKLKNALINIGFLVLLSAIGYLAWKVGKYILNTLILPHLS